MEKKASEVAVVVAVVVAAVGSCSWLAVQMHFRKPMGSKGTGEEVSVSSGRQWDSLVKMSIGHWVRHSVARRQVALVGPGPPPPGEGGDGGGGGLWVGGLEGLLSVGLLLGFDVSSLSLVVVSGCSSVVDCRGCSGPRYGGRWFGCW